MIVESFWLLLFALSVFGVGVWVGRMWSSRTDCEEDWKGRSK